MTTTVPGGQPDLVITPRVVFTEHRAFPNVQLFQDRFVCAVDVDNHAIGKTISLEQFSSLPFLATSCGYEISSGEARGSDMVTLIHERLAWIMAPRTTLRLLEPPMPLRPIHQLMLWTPRSEDDPGHRWLRRRLLTLAQELTGPSQLPAAADQRQAVTTSF